MNGGVCLRYRASSAQNVGKCKLGRCYRISGGRIHYHYALFRSGRYVDIIDPNTGAANCFQLFRALQYVGGNAGFRTDYYGVSVGYQFLDLVGGGTVGFDSFETLLFE